MFKYNVSLANIWVLRIHRVKQKKKFIHESLGLAKALTNQDKWIHSEALVTPSLKTGLDSLKLISGIFLSTECHSSACIYVLLLHVTGCPLSSWIGFFRDSPETPHSTGFCCVVLQASSIKECEDIVCRIGERLTVNISYFRTISLTCSFSPPSQLLALSIQSGSYNYTIVL